MRYEDKDNLNNAYKEKMNKYKETANFIKAKLNAVQALVVPIVVGCKGALPRITQENMKLLGLNKQDALTAPMIALRSSIEMANEFIDYDHTR